MAEEEVAAAVGLSREAAVAGHLGRCPADHDRRGDRHRAGLGRDLHHPDCLQNRDLRLGRPGSHDLVRVRCRD